MMSVIATEIINKIFNIIENIDNLPRKLEPKTFLEFYKKYEFLATLDQLKSAASIIHERQILLFNNNYYNNKKYVLDYSYNKIDCSTKTSRKFICFDTHNTRL